MLTGCNKPAEEQATQPVASDLSGRLDTILTYVDKDTNKPALTTILTYDERNKLVKVSTIDQNNALQHPTGEYTYKSGKLVRYATTHGPEPGIYQYSETAQVNVISWWSVYPHEIRRRQLIFRTQSGRDSVEIIRQFRSATDSVMVSKHYITKWNELGLAVMSRIVWFNGTDSTSYERTYRYDDNQFAVEITERSLPDGKPYPIYKGRPLQAVERFSPMKALAQFPVTEPMRYLKRNETRYLAGLPSVETTDLVLQNADDKVVSFKRTKRMLQEGNQAAENYLIKYISRK